MDIPQAQICGCCVSSWQRSALRFRQTAREIDDVERAEMSDGVNEGWCVR